MRNLISSINDLQQEKIKFNSPSTLQIEKKNACTQIDATYNLIDS